MIHTCDAMKWPRNSMRAFRCGNKAKFEHQGLWYCGTHNPISLAQKAALRRERFDSEMVEKRKIWALQGAAADLLAALKGLMASHGGSIALGEKDSRCIAARAALEKAEVKL